MNTTETPQSIVPGNVLAPLNLYFIAPVHPSAPDSLLSIWRAETALPVIFDAWIQAIIASAKLSPDIIADFDRRHWPGAERRKIIAALDKAGVPMHNIALNDFKIAQNTLKDLREKEKSDERE